MTSTALREDNTNDSAAPFFDPNAADNQNGTLFPDENGDFWVQDNGAGGFELTAHARNMGLTGSDLDGLLGGEFLFYLYDDQGPSWDFGGPEGAMGGFLRAIEPVCGDFSMDGDVDSADRTIQTQNWTGALMPGQGNATFAQGDCDADGDVDTADQNGLIQNWTGALQAGNIDSGELGLVVVPEPSACLIAAIGVCFIWNGRRSRPVLDWK